MSGIPDLDLLFDDINEESCIDPNNYYNEILGKNLQDSNSIDAPYTVQGYVEMIDSMCTSTSNDIPSTNENVLPIETTTTIIATTTTTTVELPEETLAHINIRKRLKRSADSTEVKKDPHTEMYIGQTSAQSTLTRITQVNRERKTLLDRIRTNLRQIFERKIPTTEELLKNLFDQGQQIRYQIEENMHDLDQLLDNGILQPGELHRWDVLNHELEKQQKQIELYIEETVALRNPNIPRKM
jgi:hypothetical protein